MPNPMWQWLEDFPQQVRQAVELAQGWDLSSLQPPGNVTFLGIGGSAIGADLIKALYRDQFTCSVAVVRGEEPPAWLSSDSLVVAVSYSGETRETLTAYRKALEKGSQSVCIASRGALLRSAQEKNIPYLQIPAGMAPRAALGYTSIPLIKILQSAGILKSGDAAGFLSAVEIQAIVKLLESLRVEWGDSAGAGVGVGRRLLRRLPVIIAGGFAAAVARRFQAQLAENAKALSVVFEIPEALHNLIETLDAHYIDTFRPIAVYLEDTEADALMRRQMQKVREAFQQAGIEGIPILTQGKAPLARLFTLIHKTDWISYHLATLKGVDPVTIPTITGIKQDLSTG